MNLSSKIMTAVLGIMVVCAGRVFPSTGAAAYDTRLYVRDPKGDIEITRIGLVSGEVFAEVEVSNSNSGEQLFTDDFEEENDRWVSYSGEWARENGRMVQKSLAQARSIVRCQGGEDWSDFDFSADILSPDTTPDNTNGIVFRADESMKNMYAFRIYGNTHLEFAKWIDGQFSSIIKWECQTKPDTMYNLRVLVRENSFTFYVNGEKVREAFDDSFSSGKVGLYTFRQAGVFDNVRVYRYQPGDSVDVKLIAALYNGQKVEDIQIKELNIGAGGRVLAESNPLTVESKQGRVLKVLLWTGKLSPVSSAVEFKEANGDVYYVSPGGSDISSGTYESPWRTMSKACAVKAGSIVVFEDGEFYEAGVVRMSNSGTRSAPIILRARNRHGAKIIFPEITAQTVKIGIPQGMNYITIDGFEITQQGIAPDDGATKTRDIFIECLANDCNIINNKIHHAYEEGIKVYLSYNVLIENNEIYDMNHEGIDVFNVSNSVVRGNKVRDVGRVGVMVKGGARNIVVYDNIIRSETRYMNTAGITVGGVSNSTNPYDIRRDTGFELYNSIFYNNVVIADIPGNIGAGIAYYGAKEAHCYNNIIIGAKTGVTFREPGGISNGWEWDPPNVNPVLKNNIIANCTQAAYSFIHQPQNLISEHNLFFNTPNAPQETGSMIADPQFVNINSDWRLMDTSPAIGAGTYVPSLFPGFWGKSITVDFYDYAGKPRTIPWDMGIYDR